MYIFDIRYYNLTNTTRLYILGKFNASMGKTIIRVYRFICVTTTIPGFVLDHK